jgi:glutaconate CoA-transferase, subunit A
MEILASGKGEYRTPDPEGFREFVRNNKPKGLVDKVMSEQEAVGTFVQDGDYISYDCTMFQRGPSSILREIVRQKIKDLWVGAKFTWMAATMLTAGGCVSRIDVGYQGLGRTLYRAIEEGRVKTTEWSNGAMTTRHLAGAMGVPFLPIKFLGGTGTFEYSGAKLIRDPYTGQEICIVPAINPDVAIVHVHQCDAYGNARIFGASTAPQETAMSAKKLIISTEELVENDEITRDPGRTAIPYFCVDAVVVAPFGAYPGTVPGVYASDTDHILELYMAAEAETMDQYLEKYVYGVSTHQEFLENRVGLARLMELKQKETIREGYRI